MKSSSFIVIVLISGALAGLVHGSVNLVIIEPYIDEAIGIENMSLFATGQAEDTPTFWAEYEEYRTWQKGGQILAGVILGLAIGSLFGIVYALSQKALPARNDIKNALILASIMWFTIYFIPFLKYPANPPAVGDGDTVVLRAVLYLSFIAISGFGAVGFYRLSKRLQNKRKLLALVCYAVFIITVFVAMPENPDENNAPTELLNEFRIMSVLGVSVFWAAAGLILGLLWHRYRLHEQVSTRVL